MQTVPMPLRPALNEVHRTAHDQDLLEVPKRARLDREAERITNQPPPSATPQEWPLPAGVDLPQ
jgi:hypothetical protein